MYTILKFQGKQANGDYQGARAVKRTLNAVQTRKFLLTRLKSLEAYCVWTPDKQAYPGLDASSWLRLGYGKLIQVR